MKTNQFPDVVVAVLPFEILSNEKNIQYLAVGFTEDLITDLSRFGALHVISSHSTKKINSQDATQSTLIKNLNANYLVTGSIRQYQGKIRISVQLIDAHSEAVLWGERYDEELTAIFEIQDEIIERLVSVLQKKINVNLLASSRKKTTNNLAAYECWLQGMAELERGSVESDEQARRFFEQALKIEPNYSRAYAGLSLSYFNEWTCRNWELWDASQQGAHKYAERAVALDDTDYLSLSVLGRIFLYKKAYEKAEHFLRKSLRLNPNDADNLIQIASCFIFLGLNEESKMLYEKAIRLNPMNEEWYYVYGAMIHLELGNFENSVELGLKVNLDKVAVDMASFIAAAYYHLGNKTKSQEYWKIFLRYYGNRIINSKDPVKQEAAAWAKEVNPYKVNSNFYQFLESKMSTEELINEARDSPSFTTSNIFRRENDLWQITYDGISVVLPDLKGFYDIKKLLDNPNHEFHCSELMGQVKESNESVSVFDEKARKAYQKRIETLSNEISDAESFNHSEKAASLREEYDHLVDEISKSIGLGGKIRKADSPVERARSAVTWRIRSAISKLKKSHPGLARHLSKSIVTGTFCSYAPEVVITWEVA